jgi:hypothetical protein
MKFVHKTIGVLAVGFLVLTFWSALLYWPREGCKKIMIETAQNQEVSPLAVLEGKIRIPEVSDQPIPELIILSDVLVGVGLGEHDETTDFPNYHPSLIGLPKIYGELLVDFPMKGRKILYFDDRLGLFVACWIDQKTTNDNQMWRKVVLAYAGPEGMSGKLDESLGRFTDPVVSKNGVFGSILVFDRRLHRFYQMNFEKGTVKASREFSFAGEYSPVAIDDFGKNRSTINIRYRIPGVKGSPEIDNKPQLDNFALILDQTGRLDWFDLNKMDFTGLAGYVPNLSDAYAYKICPLLWADSQRGLVVTSFSMDTLIHGTQVIFDPGGQVVQSDERSDWRSKLSAFRVARYLLENLYSPAMLFGSCAQMRLFKNSGNHASLYMPTNSFLVRYSEREVENYADYIGGLFMVVAPALILSFFLARSVKKNAVSLGLSKPACRAWFLLTIAFGVPAYITWRITRPREAMVTCKNCGKLRRPEFERCQHCNSPWHVPEITPPAWRVCHTLEDEKIQSEKSVTVG